MIKKQAESLVPTDFGRFRILAFSENENDRMPHIALIAENTDFTKTVNVRLHSECLTGEVFHSQKCECGQQLQAAMKYMQENGGIIVYLRQEGRNIGIINKLRAYALQEQGLDTVEANLALNLPADGRDYRAALEILKSLNVKEINLLTNNPDKISFVQHSGFLKLNKRIPLQIKANEFDRNYLKTKKIYFGHLFDEENL